MDKEYYDEEDARQENDFQKLDPDDDVIVEDKVELVVEKKTIIKSADEVHVHWKTCEECKNRIYKNVKHVCDFTEEEE
jgi:hypothetical protein